MIWKDGALTAPEAAAIGPADRGFLLGDGIFSTLKVIGGRPLFLSRHLCRLADSAAALGSGLLTCAIALKPVGTE